MTLFPNWEKQRVYQNGLMKKMISTFGKVARMTQRGFCIDGLVTVLFTLLKHPTWLPHLPEDQQVQLADISSSEDFMNNIFELSLNQHHYRISVTTLIHNWEKIQNSHMMVTPRANRFKSNKGKFPNHKSFGSDQEPMNGYGQHRNLACLIHCQIVQLTLWTKN